MRNNLQNYYKSILIFLMIAIGLLVCFYITIKPTEKELIALITYNGIEIPGVDSNIIDPITEKEPDSIAIFLIDEEIRQLEIIESGYDIIGRKYFAIVKIVSSSDNHTLYAKLMMFLNYDHGWKVNDEIGVLYSNFIVPE